MNQTQDLKTELFLAVKALAAVSAWIVVGLLMLLWIGLMAAVDWIVAAAMALVALPWWAFLWLRHQWRRLSV